MSVLALCIGVVAVAVAVVTVWWLDRRVLRSGNRWLTWASCGLIAWAVGLFQFNASMNTHGKSWLTTGLFTILCGQVVAIPLLIGTVASTVIEWAASSLRQRWRILVVPLVACGTMVCATVITSWMWTALT
jgi:hypothetical protein